MKPSNFSSVSPKRPRKHREDTILALISDQVLSLPTP